MWSRTAAESAGSRRKNDVMSAADPEPPLPVPPPIPRRTMLFTAEAGSLISERVKRAGAPETVACVWPSRERRSRMMSVFNAARSTRVEMMLPGETNVHGRRSMSRTRTRP